MSLATDLMHKHVDPWIGLAGGDAAYVEADGVMFAVCSADMAVAPTYVATTMAKYLRRDQCVNQAQPAAAWGELD